MTFSMTPHAIRAAAVRIELRPVLTIDGIEHFATEDVPRLREALGLNQTDDFADNSMLLSEYRPFLAEHQTGK